MDGEDGRGRWKENVKREGGKVDEDGERRRIKENGKKKV